jgi:hypothetical protein
MTTALLGNLEDEFAGAEFGDWRLEARLQYLSSDLDASPNMSLPSATQTVAGREGAYRFLSNRRVKLERVIAPHFAATAQRCRDAGKVYVASDTTEMSMQAALGGKKLGRLQGKGRGFLAHMALAVAADEVRTPLGVLGIDMVVRDDEKKKHRNTHQQKRDPARESLRWGKMVQSVDEKLGIGYAVHVMDSEADIYELLCEMRACGNRFIVRAGQNRLVDEGLLSEAFEGAPIVLTRTTNLGRRRQTTNTHSRRNPPRQGREAKLVVTSKRLSIRRPKTSLATFPEQLDLNVVRVLETNAPEGEKPVEWILLTSEPIDTIENVAGIVDGYRARWVIEEYFKALKTGCAYESRQLETTHALGNLLGIFAVIAWRLLLLRTVHRSAPDTAATQIVEPELLEALAARLRHIKEPKHLPSEASVVDLMNGIARLGGHSQSNGPPGWQVLWRGYQDLLKWADGYLAARSCTS